MQGTTARAFSKVPEVTLIFGVIKIAATTLGDSVTMTLNWSYLAGTALFLVLLIALVVAQITAYWSQGTVSVNTVNKPKVEAFY